MEVGMIGATTEALNTLTKYSLDWVTKKIEFAKQKKDIQSQQITYEEIINSLLEERLELQRAAQYYQELYESVNITDNDIEYLHNTLLKAVDILGAIGGETTNKFALQTLIKLLDKDLLKTMQLIGFSYKDGIGRPLTELCASKLLSLGKPTSTIGKVSKGGSK